MKTKVLVIEDEPIIGEMMCILLEIAGYGVISLGDTERARQKLHNGEVALVVLDLNLKGENGQSMCQYIKTNEELKHIPVVLVSANMDLPEICKSCGADDFIAKPFDIYQFTDKITTYAPKAA